MNTEATIDRLARVYYEATTADVECAAPWDELSPALVDSIREGVRAVLSALPASAPATLQGTTRA